MNEYKELKDVIARLRGKNGCPWDSVQTHESLKAACVEEAAEVLCGINIYNETGNPDNMKEELGDLLFLIMLQAQISEEEGLFSMEDVMQGIKEKMIRRHPHVFGDGALPAPGEEIPSWEAIKKQEKKDKEPEEEYLPKAFDECIDLIHVAKKRKGYEE